MRWSRAILTVGQFSGMKIGPESVKGGRMATGEDKLAEVLPDSILSAAMH